MKLIVLGLGWLGSHIKSELNGQHHIFATKTRASEGCLQFKFGDSLPQEILDSEGILIFAPPSALKNQLTELKDFVNQVSNKYILYSSSTGIYPSQPVQTYAEDSPIKPQTPRQKLLFQIEEIISTHSSCLILRLGGLVGRNRHPSLWLQKGMKKINGREQLRLVHQNDISGFIKMALDQKLTGVYNLFSPHPLTKKDYYQSMAKRADIDPPEFDSLLGSSCVETQKIEKLYNFLYPSAFDFPSPNP